MPQYPAFNDNDVDLLRKIVENTASGGGGGGGSGVSLVTSPAYSATLATNAGAAADGGFLIVQVGTLTGNITISNPTSPTNRQRIEYIFKQDGTGNRTLTLGNKFRFPASSSLSSPISATNSIEFAAPNAKTRMLVEYDLADDRWDIVSFVAGY